MNSLKHIYFDLSEQEKFHRIEWEKRIKAISNPSSKKAVVIDSPKRADIIIATDENSHLSKQYSAIPCFVWDNTEWPKGIMPGLYCNLHSFLYDKRIHRTFCFPIVHNELVTSCDTSDAKYLVGFCGDTTSGVRSRLIRIISRSMKEGDYNIKIQSGPWNAMFDRSGLPVKASYVTSLRLSKFILCPRGNTVSSIRLFETMKAMRVPVIISDNYVLPQGIDWDKCAIIVKEKNINKIPLLLKQHAGDWKEMAISARKAWEENFSDEVLLDRIVDNIEGLALTQSKAQLFIRECKYRIWKQGIKLKVVAGQTLAKLKSLT